MIRNLFFLSGIIACFMTAGIASATPASDERFNNYKESLIVHMWEIYPTWGSSLGYHKHDDRLVVPDDKSRSVEVAFCKANLDSLHMFKVAELSDANKTDYYLLENQMRAAVWTNTEMKGWQWDPSGYNVCGSFAEMLANDYAPLDERLSNFSKRLVAVPAYYEAAKKNIKNPTLEHTALAIEQNTGGMSVFTDDLKEALQKSNLPAGEKDLLQKRAGAAAEAIRDYIKWLQTTPNKTPRSFRLGKQLYDQKFAYDMQAGYTADAIYKKALARKAELHEKMYAITRQLWTKYFRTTPPPADKLKAIRMMIDQLSLDHAKPEDFQSAIERQLPTLTDFIKAKDLLYLDPSKPLVVRREPAYMAGVAGASISGPGPYDKNGNTYYNVGSLDGWSADKAESYLREYNKYILQILNIHEAIPGHYTQGVYSNQSPSIVKSILGNSTMVEGWAVYAERMMLENGYDGDKGINSTEASPEMWLMYCKWNLRSTCNTILDYSVHTKNMSREQALHMLVDEAFQQQAEAEGKWKRVSVTQVQLCCYFTGYTEIYDLREEFKKKKGTSFSLKDFHSQFLSYGSAPVKYIRQMMLKS